MKNYLIIGAIKDRKNHRAMHLSFCHWKDLNRGWTNVCWVLLLRCVPSINV